MKVLRGTIRFLTASIAVFLGGFLFWPSFADAKDVSGVLGGEHHWVIEESPYIVLSNNPTGGVGFLPGSTLTIDPGVVVKMTPGAQIGTGGTIIAHGTESQPIVFTSIFDDAADGQDSGGDGESVGTQGDWYRFSNGGSVDFDHVVVRYASDGLSVGSVSTIRNSILEYNGYGMQLNFEGTESTIEGNTIRNNNFGIIITASFDPPSPIKNNNIYDNNVLGAQNLYYPFSTVDITGNWWGDPSGPLHPILNPDGLGNAVTDGIIFDPVLTHEAGPEPPQGIDPVIIIPGILGSAQKNGIWVMDPILHTYDDLIETLVANGYVKGTNLFGFPYEWRQSNTITAEQLRDRINYVKDACGNCEKVDLVAHSMGGLVARQYIQSDYYQHDVDQLIFLGTPHLGAPKAYLTWEGGDVEPDFLSKLTKLFFSREAKKSGFSSIFDYVRNKPIESTKQLLPIYPYLKVGGNLRVYPDEHPRNTFLESLNGEIQDLYDSGVNLTNISGDIGTQTINYYRVVDSQYLPLWEHGYPENFYEKVGDRGLERSNGDGTVPLSSQSYVSQDLTVINSEHIALPDNAKVRIFESLTGNGPEIIIDDIRIPNVILIIHMRSPADFLVIDPDNKKIGKNFETGEEYDEIPGAFYSGFGTDDEYITIPNPEEGVYKIISEGTDDGGEYTVAVGYISDDDSSETEFTGHTTPGAIQELNLTLNSEATNNLEIEPEDANPPNITISSPVVKDYIRSEILPISISVLDEEVGVFDTDVVLDGLDISEAASIDLFYQKLGSHTLTVNVSDYVGNTSTVAVDFRIIATLASTISDINRCYSLGWIDDPGIRDSLLAKIKSDKIQAKALLNELSAQKEKHITIQAYDLLIEDINWLLNN